MMKRTVLIIPLLISAHLCLAQNYLFRVMANNGSNQFKSVTAKEWSPIKRGVSFNSGDMVKIVDKAYLGLIHKSGKTIELNNPGTFQIDEIELNIDTKKRGIGSKYTEFVMNSLDESNDYGEPEELSTRGAETSIELYIPSSSEVLQPVQIVKWKKVNESDSEVYILNIKGIFDDVLLSEEVSSNEYVLNLNDPSLKNETTIVLTVSLKENDRTSSTEYAFDRLSGTEASTYTEELNEIKNGLDLDSSIDQVLLAYYFEEKELLTDAITCYNKAIQISPDIDDYKELFESFCSRHNINH